MGVQLKYGARKLRGLIILASILVFAAPAFLGGRRSCDSGEAPCADSCGSERRPGNGGKKLRKKKRKHIVNSVGIRLIYVPPGEFLMGSPAEEKGRWEDEKLHRVRLTQGFYLGETEVTWGQFTKIFEAREFKRQYSESLFGPPLFSQQPEEPVASVTWEIALKFCTALTVKERKEGLLPLNEIYRLPTEAEWEYACRAGTRTPYFFGSDVKLLGKYAWFLWNTQDMYLHPVKQKRPNPWGFYDQYGNAAEWCLDFYGEYPEGLAIDPMGPSKGEDRVVRGGSSKSEPFDCRSAVRLRAPPKLSALGGRVVGFRIVRAKGSLFLLGKRLFGQSARF